MANWQADWKRNRLRRLRTQLDTMVVFAAILLLLAALFAGSCQDKPRPTGPTPPTTTIVLPPTPPTPSNPHHYGRTLWTGPFYATDTRYGYFDTPGNVEVILAGTDPIHQVGSRRIIADNEDPLGWGRSADRTPCDKLLAVYLNTTPACVGSNCDGRELDYARLRADQCSRPVLVYYDRTNSVEGFRREWLRPGDWVGINAYPDVVPAVPDAARDLADLDRALAEASGWGHPIAIIRPFYTRTQQWPLSLILEMQVPITDLIRRYPLVVADLWFSWSRPDLPRPSGATDYPELQQHALWLDEAGRTGR